jgi:hypothetical protein
MCPQHPRIERGDDHVVRGVPGGEHPSHPVDERSAVQNVASDLDVHPEARGAEGIESIFEGRYVRARQLAQLRERDVIDPAVIACDAPQVGVVEDDELPALAGPDVELDSVGPLAPCLLEGLDRVFCCGAAGTAMPYDGRPI